MNLPPAIIVHGLAEARAALAPGLPVTLLSAPGAACHAGIGWWRALVALARAEARAELADILDCADAPGEAVEALRAGCRVVVLSADMPAWPDVAARAAQLGAVLLAVRPPALDLSRTWNVGQVASWLRDSQPTIG